LLAGSLAIGAAQLATPLAVAATSPSIAVQSANGWTDFLGSTRMLHLVANAKNQDPQQDASLITVGFDLLDANGNRVGLATADTGGLRIVGHDGTSPYRTDIPAPSAYDHFRINSVGGAAAATAPDQNFTITSSACLDVADPNHLCGTITNTNAVRVDGVRVVFTFYADPSMTQIADGDAFSIDNTDGTSSLDAGASTGFEFVRPTGSPAWASMSETADASTTTPAAPFDVFATAGNRAATLSWSAPPDGGRAITSYTVNASPADGTPTVSGTTATVSGLRNGITYTFTVTATSAYGTGPPSAPSNAVVPATVPDAPSITSVTPGDSSVLVTWSAPFNEGSPITSYLVAANPPDNTVVVDGSQTSATVTGLANGRTYTFTVSARNALGSGPPSTPSAPATPAVPPGAPTQVAATAGDGSAQVTWHGPGSNGGSPVTTYTVTSAPDGKTASTDGNTTAATVTGLTNGISYTFTVTASNAVGTGPASAPSNAVTPAGPNPPPPPPPAFGSWERLGGVLAFPPVASTSGSGYLDVFAGGTDGVLYDRYLNPTSNGWQWQALPGSGTRSVASAISTAAGSVDVFVRGGDLALWHRSFSGGAWGDWQRLGGVLASAPAAVSLGGGRMAAFVQGTDNHLYVDALDPVTGWSWARAGGVLASPPIAVSAAPGAADAFLMGTDGALWHWSSAAGGTWTRPGGRISGTPAATVRSDGAIDAFVAGIDGALWHWSSPNGGQWEGLGGRISLSPCAVSADGTRLDVFVRGTDGALWHDGINGLNGSTWSWEGLGGDGLGGPLTSAPSAVSWGPGRLDVVARGSDGALWHLATQ
jgi:Fibronectin type III domain